MRITYFLEKSLIIAGATALSCLNLYSDRRALVEASLFGCNFVPRIDVHYRLYFKRETI